ncbi:MAG: MFS transporter [Clostridiales bacterium]|jgi:GPH family glycoside/pentoside/hexuronide:cation symporter|nr:MFS transporter [Clostridiales bacterium]MDR2749057.1 MFS transporter [Clostridiales bacterium]
MKKKIGTAQMIILAIGVVGETFLMATISSYAMIFFAPTAETGLPLLLPIGAIGVIQGIGFAFDCLIDPFIAHRSDNSKNPKGKRIPMMRLAFIPAGLFCGLIFMAPESASRIFNVGWVVVSLLVYSFFRSVYDVNRNALIPEIMHDSKQRDRYFVFKAIFTIPGSILVTLVPAVVSGLMSGGFDPLLAWRYCILIFPVLGVLLMAVPAFLIKETDYSEPVKDNEKKYGILESIKLTLSLSEFRKIMLGATFFDIAVYIPTTVLLHIITVLLDLSLGMGTFIMLFITILQIVLYPVILKMSKKVYKKNMMLISIGSCALAFVLIFFHQPISAALGTQQVPPGILASMAGETATMGNFLTLVLIGLAFVYPIAASGTVGSSMFADIAVFDKVKTGRSSAGMFMAVMNLTAIIKETLIPAIAGSIIYLGSTGEEPSAMGLRATVVVSMAFIVPTIFFYASINEKEIKAAIAQDEKAALAQA